MYVYVAYDHYDGQHLIFENKENIPETNHGEKVEIVTQGELSHVDTLILDNYATNPIAYIKGENDKYYFLWDDYSCREVRKGEIEMITSLEPDEEANAFNAMVDMYILYKSGGMDEEMIEMMNKIAENWIEHTETELIQLGLKYHKQRMN